MRKRTKIERLREDLRDNMSKREARFSERNQYVDNYMESNIDSFRKTPNVWMVHYVMVNPVIFQNHSLLRQVV